MNEIQIAVVGCGYIAQAEHIPSILSSKYARLAAIIEPRRKLRETLAARFGVPTFSGLSELADSNVQVDAVDVCAGPLLHPKLISDSLMQAGMSLSKSHCAIVFANPKIGR